MTSLIFANIKHTLLPGAKFISHMQNAYVMQFFTLRTLVLANNWNSLPGYYNTCVVESVTTNLFKNSLGSFWFN